MDVSRRWFLGRLVRGTEIGMAAAAVTSTEARAQAGRGQAEDSRGATDTEPQRRVVVNADDLGMSRAVDAGILEAHDRGIVTSASLMVDGPDVDAAVRQAKLRPRLGVGVHVVFDDRDAGSSTCGTARSCGASSTGSWRRSSGSPGAHRRTSTRIITRTLLRSVEPGVSEVSCHPGRVEPGMELIYNREREVELRALVDSRVRAAVSEAGIRLINFATYRPSAARRALAGCPGGLVVASPKGVDR